MKELEGFKRDKEFLVCIDSDGCLLDNMELKHKECFAPATVNVYNLQGVSKYARECAEFVNLYSIYRGINRFPSIALTLDLLFERPEVKERGLTKPDLTGLKQWIETTPALGGKALREYIESTKSTDESLLQALRWSDEVEENFKRIVRNISAFPYVKESLEKLRTFANVVVVSSAPSVALKRELHECGVDSYFDVIMGQDVGSKSACIKAAKGDFYKDDHVLKIGDANTDYKAAQDNNALFYPIVSSLERDSWKDMSDFVADSFKNGEYKTKYMQGYLDKFYKKLPEKAPWE